MSQSPNPSATSHATLRGANGRFAKGNAGGPGKPFARHVAQLRTALVSTVTAQDMRDIAHELLVQAKMGNREAIKLLL